MWCNHSQRTFSKLSSKRPKARFNDDRIYTFLQNGLWERGKNRLSLTSRRIREAFSPPGSPIGGEGTSFDGQISSDEDESDLPNNGSFDTYNNHDGFSDTEK